jgi:hypothetical protein
MSELHHNGVANSEMTGDGGDTLEPKKLYPSQGCPPR